MFKSVSYSSNQPKSRNEPYSTLLTSDIHSSATISTISNQREAESPMKNKIKLVHSQVEFRSVLKIRPFNDIEEEETEVFSLPEKDPHTVYLLRPNHSAYSLNQNKHDDEETGLSFHFDQIIDSKCSQSRMYDEIGGADMAWDVIDTIISHGSKDDKRSDKNHVIISLGVSNSGKTYSTFGLNESSKEKEGIVPRLVDDIFATHHDPAMLKFLNDNPDLKKESKLILECSMVHVHNDHIYDMLTTLSDDANTIRGSSVLKTIELFENSSRITYDPKFHTSTMKELKITRDKDTLDFVVNASQIFCYDADDARKVISVGLKNGMVSSTRMNQKSSRGHTVITLRPILLFSDHRKIPGSTISVLDMAGIERTKGSSISAGQNLRESVAINSTISAVLQCFRSIKSAQLNVADEENLAPEVVSVAKNLSMSIFRQNKLLMLLQPLLSGYKSSGNNVDTVRTSVKLFVSVYPGAKDYNEKKMLLSEIDALRGMSIQKAILHRSFVDNESYQEISKCDTTNKSRTDRQSTPLALAKLAKRKRINTSTKIEESHSLSSSYKKQNKNGEGLYDDFQEKISKLEQANSTMIRTHEDRCKEFIDKIQSLEEENSSWKNKYESMRKKCQSLQKENREYQQMLEESVERERSVLMRHKGNLHEQEEDRRFLEYRNIRRNQQTLLQPEIARHVEKVEQTKCLASGKIGRNQQISPFKLSALYNCTPNSEQVQFSDLHDQENPSIEASDTFESTHSA